MRPTWSRQNVFALGPGPTLLIDTGPRVPGSLDYLESGLRAAGFGFEDIEAILLTHGHVDHFGLVQEIRKAAKRRIDCFLHPHDRLHASPDSFEGWLWDREKEDFLRKAGTSPEEIEKVLQAFVWVPGYRSKPPRWNKIAVRKRFLFRKPPAVLFHLGGLDVLPPPPPENPEGPT